jgi:hypothetical protein
MALVLFFAMLYIKNTTRDNESIDSHKIIAPICMATALLITVYLCFQEPVNEAINRLFGRVFVDSRSGQYDVFFSQVSFSHLILGGGPNASWQFGTADAYREYQYFDNAFLWMAFIGGLPLMCSYLIVIIFPGIRLLFRGVAGNTAAAAILIALWGVACTGISTYTNPSLTPYSYLICLLAGRCLGALAEARTVRSV